MKAVIFEEHGGPEVLKYVEDFPTPERKEGEVLLKIKTTSLNRADIVVRNGYPGLTIPLPHILGGDIIGEVAEVGSESIFSVGDRVISMPMVAGERHKDQISGFDLPEHQHLALDWKYFGMHTHGSYAEYISVPESIVLPLSDSISNEDATGIGVAGLTAYHGLVGVGKLQKDELFMIWGGAGGLGSNAVQIAKSLGAKVIATVGSDEKINTLKELGADYVLNHNTQDIEAEVRKINQFGVDVILDYVGPKTFQISHDLLKKGGRLLLCGILTGRESNLSIHMTYLKHISIHGFYLGTIDEMKALLDMMTRSKIKTLSTKKYSLKDAAQAHKDLESGDYVGKIILEV